jgi:hypothetical protein
MRDKKVWDAVNKMPTYTKKSKTLTEEQVKRVLLDCTEVNPECPESVRKYGERCEMIGELYNGYKNYMKIVGERNTKPQVDQHTTKEIERLLGYKDEYIG